MTRMERVFAQLRVAELLDRGSGQEAPTISRVELQAVRDLMAEYVELRERDRLLRPEAP